MIVYFEESNLISGYLLRLLQDIDYKLQNEH